MTNNNGHGLVARQKLAVLLRLQMPPNLFIFCLLNSLKCNKIYPKFILFVAIEIICRAQDTCIQMTIRTNLLHFNRIIPLAVMYYGVESRTCFALPLSEVFPILMIALSLIIPTGTDRLMQQWKLF